MQGKKEVQVKVENQILNKSNSPQHPARQPTDNLSSRVSFLYWQDYNLHTDIQSDSKARTNGIGYIWALNFERGIWKSHSSTCASLQRWETDMGVPWQTRWKYNGDAPVVNGFDITQSETENDKEMGIGKHVLSSTYITCHWFCKDVS